MDFTVPHLWYSKLDRARAGPRIQGKKRRRKDLSCLLELGCLATYVDYVPCVNPSILGGGIYTTTVGSKSGGNGQCKLTKEKRE